jgi:nicotinamidase-related amidase
VTIDELFRALDLEEDGELSRAELHRAARRLGWHWPEAPLHAVLDLLTLQRPLSRAAFAACLEQILRDPLGPYGEVLRAAPGPAWSDHAPAIPAEADAEPAPTVVELLERLAGAEAAADHRALLGKLEHARLRAADAALLVIDPQRAFTAGSWMRSIGPTGPSEVEPIGRAFARCAALLAAWGDRIETVFTRCPFPPESYAWDARVAAVIHPARPYFVKPGNSALWPPTNGFARWAEGLLDRGLGTLVIGGCTLNSCVRVSAVETRQLLGGRGLQVVVDLDLCGARTANYLRSPLFGGRSSVASAVEEMSAAGVRVAQQVSWS